jgi:malonate transporter and related proteins
MVRPGHDRAPLFGNFARHAAPRTVARMATLVLLKLLAIFVIVAIGWIAGRMKWLGDKDPARTLSAAAFYVFVPALLFRTTARVDLAALPWATLAAFFVPVLMVLVGLYVYQRMRHGNAETPADPSTRALSATFGNTVQVGIPTITALFGEAGLSVHLAIVSLHALVLLTVATTLVELDVVRSRRELGHSNAHLGLTLARTVRATLIHPVVLPVIAGLVWNALHAPLPAIADEILVTLGQAVVPLCLVLIGLSLATYGVAGVVRGAITLTLLKLVALPACVLAIGHWGMGLTGIPLSVVVVGAALPVGSNPLIFAQRYRALEGEVTAAIVFSTLGFVVAAPAWLAVLARIG